MLYHGSPFGPLPGLLPRHHFLIPEGEVVFASTKKIIALLFTARWSDSDFSLGRINEGPYILRELRKNAFVSIFSKKSGFLYSLEEKGFQSDPRLMQNERISFQKVIPHEMIRIPDLLKEVLSFVEKKELFLWEYDSLKNYFSL